MRIIIGLFLGLITLGIAGCSGSAPPAIPPITIDTARFVLDAEPAGAREVIALRKEAKDGDAVVVIGKIGGRKDPVMEDRGVFMIVDTSLKPCVDDPDCFDFL